MSRWWDQSMSDAGQALYSDPSLAVSAATVPSTFMSQQAMSKYADQMQQQSSFMGTLGNLFGKTDAWLSNIPGWGIAKEAISYPVDKTAQGLRWVYSNALSRPISTVLLESAKADLGGGSYFSGSDWADSFKQAKHISPGQAFMNYENTAEASGQGTALSSWLGDAGQGLSSQQKDMVSQNVKRFIYDTNYWKSQGDSKYNVGSGSLDFMFNVIDPLSGAIIGGTAKTVKAARGVQMVAQDAANAATVGTAGVARTRGPIIDIFKEQQTPEQVAQLPSMQKAFDWMKQDGRTVEEIANHPMWGKGRRANPARYDIARLVSDTPRDNLEQVWRFALGDSNAASDLAQQAPSVLKKLGQTMDNRVLLEGTKMNLSMLQHFKANYEGDASLFAGDLPGALKPKPEADPNLLLEPPYPRPTEPGPRQSGWDATWGQLQQKADVHRQAAQHIVNTSPLRIGGPASQTTLADGLVAQQWKADQLTKIGDDYDELVNSEKWLGAQLGQMTDWTPAASPLFGAINRMYRMGGMTLKDTENAAEQAALKSARGARASAYSSRFMMTTVKRGMGAPISIIHNFGNRTPQGFVDHTADDAHDRVFDMLKQVKGMSPEARLDLMGVYNAASNKTERSSALDQIHDAVMNHILINENDLHPDIAEVLRGAIKDGIGSKMAELTGKGSFNQAQRFGPAATSAEDIQKLTGEATDDLTPVRSDAIATHEDGTGIVISPLAQTQLSSSDVLFPVREINRLVGRSRGAFQGFRGGTANAKDWVVNNLDGFDNLWKTATLLRPGFIPRMVSDEVLARAVKFGNMATLMDTAKGGKNFLSNRTRQLSALMGRGDYTPATGKGIASNRAVVNLDDESEIGQLAKEHGLPVSKVRVPPTLSMVYNRIGVERQELADAQKELKGLKEDASPEYRQVLQDRIADHQNVIDEHHDYLSEILRRAQDATGKRLGDGDFEYKIGGTVYHVKQAFNQEWDNPIPRDQISSEGAWKNLFSRQEMIDRQRFWSHAEKTGAYKQISPDDPNHMQSWLDAVNKQIRQDPFHRMIAGGMNDGDALTYLTRNPRGRAYMQQMGYWNRDKPQFVRNVRYMVDKYIGDPILKQKIADGQIVTEGELRKTFAQDEFPVVHGEEIKENSALGVKETARNYLDNKMDKAWKQLADIPADVMSRHPTFLRLHQAEMENLVRQQYIYKMQNEGTDAITPKEWEQMNQKAASRATQQMRQIVYDPVNTVGSQGLRFVYPFFKPFIDGVDRWAGLVAERPEGFVGLGKIYNAPVAANLVTDQQGNSVGSDGYATIHTYNKDTGKMETSKKFVPITDRMLHLKMPWAKGPTGDIPIRMNSFNTILPGDPWFDPGTGPIVQVAGNQLAKSNPEVGDFLQWAKVLPYGPSDSTADMFTPKYLKEAIDAWNGKDVNNTAYQQAVLDTFNMRVAHYYEQIRAGDKHAVAPKMEDIQKDAKNFMWLQALMDWVSPVSTKGGALQGTPYQFYADQAKAMQSTGDPKWRDHFLAQFGEDYFGFTQGLTKSLGVAASIPANKQYEKYKDLIEQDPSMAPLVIGDMMNGGAFSSSVYLKQMNDEVGGQRVRERMTAEEAIKQMGINKSWSQYMNTKNALDAELIRAGFTSYTQKGAEVFQQAKQNMVANLSAQNPDWAQAYGTTDRNAIPNRINFMEKLVTDPKILQDPTRIDMRVLAQYLLVRNQFKQMLAQRGQQQLSFNEAGAPTGQSADLGYQWRQYQTYFVNSSVQFGNIFNRYLDNDDLQ